MGFLKWLVESLGSRNHKVNGDAEDENNSKSVEETHHYVNSNLPRKGFSVSVQVPVDRAHQMGPILVPCPQGDGGVQGLGWYTKRLKIDEDGDVADEFLEEVFPETHQITSSKFQVKLTTKPAKARNPRLSQQGTVQQLVEFQGRLQLV